MSTTSPDLLHQVEGQKVPIPQQEHVFFENTPDVAGHRVFAATVRFDAFGGSITAVRQHLLEKSEIDEEELKLIRSLINHKIKGSGGSRNRDGRD